MNTLLLRSLVVLTLVVLILAIPIPRGSIELDNKVLIGGYVTASDALKPPVPNGYQTITGSNPASSSPHIEDQTSAARTRRPAAKNRSASSDAPDKPKPPERTESEDKAFKDPRNASVEELEGLINSATSGYPVGVPPPHSGNFGTGIPTIVGVSGSPHPPPLMSAVNPGEIYVVHHVENPHHTSSEVPTLAGISGPPHPPPPASVVNPGEIYAVHHVDIPHHTSSEIPTSTGVSGLPHPPPPVSAIHHVETPHYPFPQVPQVSDHDNQNFGSTALSLDNHWVAYSQTGHNPNLPTGIGIGGLGTGTGGNHITSHIPVAASPPSSNPYMYDAAGTLPWHGLLHPYPDVTNMGAVTADHHAIGGGMDMWGTGDHHSLATAETLVHIDPHMAALPPLDPHAYLGLEHHSHDPYAIDPSHSGPTASTGSLGMGQHHAMGDVMDDHDHHPLGITGSVGAVHNDIDSQIAALLASDPHSTFALAHHLDKPYAIAPSHGGPTVNTNTGSLALYGPPTMNDPQAVPNTHYTHLIRMRQSPPMGVLPQMQVH
ncbi:hypothetical protein H0H93_012423 [Arthromyces matolae]|nr:hypothetical protein H0H93_012423 [Arthromyces matolae]